jgi:hypothetical protein
MSDGAHLGITADRALNTILGGDPPPSEEETQTPSQVRERVMKAPKMMEGKAVYKRFGKEAYCIAVDCLARAFLEIAEQDPSVLHEGGSDPTDPLWDEFTKRYPEGNDWLGGVTGFQVGFAMNTVRYILSVPRGGNPALITINV